MTAPCNHTNWKLDKHYFYCPDCQEEVIEMPIEEDIITPEPPPCRTFKDIPFVGLVETRESIKRTADWRKRNDNSSI